MVPFGLLAKGGWGLTRSVHFRKRTISVPGIAQTVPFIENCVVSLADK